jgi:hypothetical protein
MKVLDLFAGLKGWSEPFEARGHEVFSVDLDERFDVSSHADIETLVPGDLPWRPDIILASPPCEAFSVMTIGRNWTVGHEPKTEKAELAIRLVEATTRLIDELEPKYFVIENPRAKLRKLPVVAGLDRVTVSYCQYGEPYMKPTDLWGGFPPSFEPKPICKPKASCHASAARGSTTGIQRGTMRTKFRGGMIEDMSKLYSTDPRRHALSALRAKIPEPLALAICLAAEADFATGTESIPGTLGL